MFYRLRYRLNEYRLRHLSIGRVKQDKKKGYTDFHIEKISWDVHWLTHLYLAVIIRDYLRAFIKNSPAIGNCVIDDESFHTEPHYVGDDDRSKALNAMHEERTDFYARKWKDLVNSVADEFDELIKLEDAIDTCEGDISDLRNRKKALEKKAFADLAYIFDDLSW